MIEEQKEHLVSHLCGIANFSKEKLVWVILKALFIALIIYITLQIAN